MLLSTKTNHNSNKFNKKKIEIEIENTILTSFSWYVS